jgi:hypothetical protein
MTLQENIDRLKILMDLKEQMFNQEIINQIENGDFSNLKEYLSQNSSLRENLFGLFRTNTVDDLYNKLSNSNKTLVMKGMQVANQNKDLETYNFLDKILKFSNNLS